METNENQNANTQNNAQSNDWQTVKTGEVVGKPEAEKNYNGIAIASFICGLVGLFYYQIPCGIAALITGIIGLIKYNPEKEKGKCRISHCQGSYPVERRQRRRDYPKDSFPCFDSRSLRGSAYNH